MPQVPPRKPRYTEADLWPPGSRGNFPLAAFHPIYLSNFLCQEPKELVLRVQQFFAMKGLLARMVFVRSAENDPFRNYQDKTKLYDCLVYFTRSADAEDAVKYLHREKYYGHRLNMFPGRTAVRMDPASTVGYVLSNTFSRWPNTLLEDHIVNNTQTIIKCSRRLSERHLVVQYADEVHLHEALRRYAYLEPHPLAGQVFYLQRFVEGQVMREIQDQIKIFPLTTVLGPALDALCIGSTSNVPTGCPNPTIVGNARMQQKNVAIKNKKTFRKSKLAIKNEKTFRNYRKNRIKRLEREAAQFRVKLPWQAAMEAETGSEI